MATVRPLRKVSRSVLLAGRGSILGDQGRKTYWWELFLDCGHRVERRIRYLTPGPRGGWDNRSVDDVAPAPKRARCDTCQARRGARPTRITDGEADALARVFGDPTGGRR